YWYRIVVSSHRCLILFHNISFMLSISSLIIFILRLRSGFFSLRVALLRFLSHTSTSAVLGIIGNNLTFVRNAGAGNHSYSVMVVLLILILYTGSDSLVFCHYLAVSL